MLNGKARAQIWESMVFKSMPEMQVRILHLPHYFMKQTKSYVFFKNRTQEIFDFAVLVTISVPVLKQNIGKFKKGLIKNLPEPDYFEPSVVYEIKEQTLIELEGKIENEKIESLKTLENIPLNSSDFKTKVTAIIGKENFTQNRLILKKQSTEYIDNINSCTSNYQAKLATYLYFSTFSYFEAFITDVSKELIEQITKINQAEYIQNHSQSAELTSDRLKLDKEFDPRKKDRYTKFSKKLDNQGYKSPKEILISTLSDLLILKIENLKSVEIPEFLEKTLLLELSEKEKHIFHSLRNNRNSIGHGKNSFSPTLSSVIEANKFFKALSNKVDKHIIFHFFELKNYSHK